MRPSPLLHLLLVPLWGCHEANLIGGVVGDGDWDSAMECDCPGDSGECEGEGECECEDSGLDTGDPDPMWDEAWLKVEAPTSGSFLPMDEEAAFEAAVYDADGENTGFEDIVWTSSIDEDWSGLGANFTDDSLALGKHDFTATAHLVNGDRLAYSVGDVLVQSPYAGTYAGSVYAETSLEYDGVDYTFSCAGGANGIVGMEGEEITGDAECMLSLMGYDMDMAYVIEATNTDGAVDGYVGIDLMFYTYEMDGAGKLTEDGELYIDFEGEILGYLQLYGTVELSRISRDTELSDE